VLHLRVLCPAERSEQVRQLLLDAPGVAHLTVLPGVAVRPPGDVLEATLTRECADEVLDALTKLGVDRSGGITLEAIDTVLSDSADAAEAAVPGDPADAVIWDELVARTREESTLNVTFLMFLCLACLIAAVGVITDSPVTVVGAMVVGPEFGPLAGLAVALVQRRMYLARRALIALVVGFPVAMAVTAVTVLAGEALGWVNLESTRQLSQVDFIFQVRPLSFVVALFAGAAGMLSLVSAKSAALVGVFISATTVPAAGFAVVAATVGDWDIAAKSTVQLAVNLVGIVLAGVLVLWARRVAD
jgi:uncharacterized hydrophobic protein (TIGR00271 family)